jgi:hypothetical protein
MNNSKPKATKNSFDVLAKWKVEFTEEVKFKNNINKIAFKFSDAVNIKNYKSPREDCFIDVDKFLNSNPLRNNDYSKYVSCYIEEDKKLNVKFFRNDIEKLNEYYLKVDELKKQGIKFNPFNELAYKNYVLYMVLKLKGQYLASDDMLFNVEVKDNREYNPLTKIPSVLRGELPYDVKEYDIVRAFPTFIDIELESNYRELIYEKIDKKIFATLLNSNKSNPNIDIKSLRKSLSVVYGDEANKVLTDDRFETKAKAFLDFSGYEKQYIEQFVLENKLVNYVRLHDGVFVLSETDCDRILFGKVKFSIKKCIKPEIKNETVNFYRIDDFGNVNTSRTLYADFFKQEKFKRISTLDDKVQLLLDTNNVVDLFNYKTNIVSFLESNINESLNYSDMIREQIARESSNVIYTSFNLIPPSELIYYLDSKTSFGLPFKNGFFYFDTNTDDGAIKDKVYSDVKGYFSPHKIQTRNFKYTDEAGMFEKFLTRVAIDRVVADSPDTININGEFQKMFGYLCHTYKSQTNAPSIIFTDEGANDENRNGGRGKTIVTKALSEVLTSMLKGGNEFDASYTHVFADLERKHKIYIIDDVPAGFKYDDLYTNILGGINCQRKGSKAELIEFEDSPKFVITSNWVVRYDEKNASTNRRFLEYKFSSYYNQHNTPKDDFKCTFFEDWDDEEWNRFYSFVFRCVKLFLADGLKQIPYNKTNDNYLALFNNASTTDEFERIIDILIKKNEPFGVNDFLTLYDVYDNPLRIQKMFHSKNVKKLIDVWIDHNLNDKTQNKLKFISGKRKWIQVKS